MRGLINMFAVGTFQVKAYAGYLLKLFVFGKSFNPLLKKKK